MKKKLVLFLVVGLFVVGLAMPATAHAGQKGRMNTLIGLQVLGLLTQPGVFGVFAPQQPYHGGYQYYPPPVYTPSVPVPEACRNAYDRQRCASGYWRALREKDQEERNRSYWEGYRAGRQ